MYWAFASQFNMIYLNVFRNGHYWLDVPDIDWSIKCNNFLRINNSCLGQIEVTQEEHMDVILNTFPSTKRSETRDRSQLQCWMLPVTDNAILAWIICFVNRQTAWTTKQWSSLMQMKRREISRNSATNQWRVKDGACPWLDCVNIHCY